MIFPSLENYSLAEEALGHNSITHTWSIASSNLSAWTQKFKYWDKTVKLTKIERYNSLKTTNDGVISSLN